ncbi:hypothetical protein, partial [Streptomyces sp. NPDC001380]|uniref:hypothetical protein n=1 Tax=Streptomyces sp. NPDC001380 TaxID=3364566 RepID=UPI0036C24A23
MLDANTLVNMVFSGLSALVVEDVADEGEVIRVAARTENATLDAWQTWPAARPAIRSRRSSRPWTASS